MQYLKHIPLEKAHNIRDLGGYPAAQGKATRWGLLYRSDALSELTKSDWEKLQQRNIKTIIDLRSERECAAAPIFAPEEMVCLHFSLMNQLDSNLKSASRENIIESMKLDYVKTLFGNLSCGAQILHAILERMDSGAVLFLCSAGKDRTGIVAALVLYLCGVMKEDIIADYIVSATYNADGINKKLENLPPQMLAMVPDMQLLKDCFASKPETIQALLEAFEQRDIRQALAENGFSHESQELLQKKFTE